MPSNIDFKRHQGSTHHSESSKTQTTDHHREDAHLPTRQDVARRIKDLAHSASPTPTPDKTHSSHQTISSLLEKHFPQRNTITNRDVINALYQEFGPNSRNTYNQAEKLGINIDLLAKHRESPFTISASPNHSHAPNSHHAENTIPLDSSRKDLTAGLAKHSAPALHGIPGEPYQDFKTGLVDRSRFTQELRNNPHLRVELTKLAVKEVSSRGPTATVAFYESLFNRATHEGLSIQRALHNGYYGPINRKEVDPVPTNTKVYANAEKGLATALAGTDIIEGRQHQEQNRAFVLKMGGDPSTFLVIKGEIFYDKFKGHRGRGVS